MWVGDNHSAEEMGWRIKLFLDRLEEVCKDKDNTARVACKTTQQLPFVVYEIDIYTKDVDDCYVIQYNQVTGEVRGLPNNRR